MATGTAAARQVTSELGHAAFSRGLQHVTAASSSRHADMLIAISGLLKESSNTMYNNEYQYLNVAVAFSRRP